MKFEICGFENIHRHSDRSLQDGFSTVHEYAAYSKEANQKFLCITDHGVMGAVPQQISEAETFDLFPIYGCELYVSQMQPFTTKRSESAEFRTKLSEEDKKLFDRSHHLLAIAYNEIGYKNLVKITTWGWLHGFYRKPRVNYEILQQYKEGIIFTSCCAVSEIAYNLFNYGEDKAFEVLEKYIAMFGEFFRLEIMMLDFKMQKPYDAFIIKAHHKYGTPLHLTQDCLVKGTTILTSDGIKCIEDIKIGDKVVTHNNRLRKVEFVNKRTLNHGEKVFRVKTALGSYAWELTGNHLVRVAKIGYIKWNIQKKEFKSFSWKKTDELTNKDYLVVPKLKEDIVFSETPLEYIDLMQYLDDDDFINDLDRKNNGLGNLACQLGYNEYTKTFISYWRMNLNSKIEVPRYLPVTEDLLKLIGLYMAEGSSEKKGNIIDFARNIKETAEAKLVERFFSKFNIKIYDRNVSKEGMSSRFSSKLWNKVFGKMCGFGANNKHFPIVDGLFFKRFSKEQIIIIVAQYWKGDGNNEIKIGDDNSVCSTSKTMLSELVCVMNALGFVVNLQQNSNKGRKHKNPRANSDKWAMSYHINLNGNRGINFTNLLYGLQNDIKNLKYGGKTFIENDEFYFIKIKSIKTIDYNEEVYNIQVEEDESYCANMFLLHNCHYCKKEHSKYQRLMLMNGNNRTLKDIQLLIDSGKEEIFELQDANLWMKTEDELNEKWEADYQDVIDYEIFKEAKRNTVKICEFAKGVKLDRSIKLPQIPDANEKLLEEIQKGRIFRQIPSNKIYLDRIKEEYQLICYKDFSSYFLIQKLIVDEARKSFPKLYGWGTGAEAVGVGRGSGVSSLVCYLLGITDIDPIKHDLLFWRFLSPARGGKMMKCKYSVEPVKKVY